MLYFTREITQNISYVYVQKTKYLFHISSERDNQVPNIQHYECDRVSTELFPLDHDTES